jgi:hypothetical protein
VSGLWLHIRLLGRLLYAHTFDIMQQILTQLELNIFFHNNSLEFQCVPHPKDICTLHFKCPHRWKSLAALGEVTDILKVLSNHVCYNTQAMPKFQVVNFLYVTLLTPRFLKWPEVFWKICVPQPQCVYVIHPFARTCENNMQSFMVCVD